MSNTLTKQPLKKASGVAVHHHNSPATKKSEVGVVSYCVHGQTGKMKAGAFTASKLIEALQAGLPVRELDELQPSLGLPMEKLAPMLGISKATLHRRKAEGRLAPAESDRVVRFARLLGKAVEVMES